LSTVHPLFDLSNLTHQVALTRSPFPSNVFTVADCTQNTGRRVNLPGPDDPLTYVSDAQDTQVINTLDGFNLQPRLSIPFDGPINVNSVNSQDVFLVRMGDTLNRCDHDVHAVGINQIVWDPGTNRLHVESDELLDQHTRYALIVTNGVHDAAGQPIKAETDFRLAPVKLLLSRDPVLRSYGLELVEGLVAAYRVGVRPQDIVGASVFTTQSATAMLEKIRDQIHEATPAPADFLIGPNGARTVFDLSNVNSITFNAEKTAGKLSATTLNKDLLQVVPGAVGQVAFGKYSSPNYLVPGQYIPTDGVGTRTGAPVVQGFEDIYFNLFLPSGTEPANGWPVAIFGHSVTNNKNNEPLAVAAKMAEQGIATIAINAAPFGFGALGTLVVNQGVGGSVTFSAGGRSFDQDGNGTIDPGEGQNATAPRTILLNRDTQQQTVADLMQLVRVIEVGMDVNGDGHPDLDPSRISYFGGSLGGMYGTVFLAVEPDVQTGVPVVPGGGQVEFGRLSPIFRRVAGQYLASRTPSLLNSPGVTWIDGVQLTDPAGNFFNESMPLRNRVPMTVTLADGTTRIITSPVVDPVPGAMAIQQAFENAEWVMQASNPVAYAPHLRKDPLPGVPAKSVLFQFAKGDQSIPNPTNTAIVRAGDLADRTTFYRHDLAYAENAALEQVNPHGFMTAVRNSEPLVREIAQGAQRQIATFFATDGQVILDLADITTTKDTPLAPKGTPLFEVPIKGSLPEGLNFPGSPPAALTDTLNGVPLMWSLSTTYVPRSNPLSRAALPTSALVDLAIEALPPLGRLDSALDVNNLAIGLLTPARRRR
jgi:hypothetical protein